MLDDHDAGWPDGGLSLWSGDRLVLAWLALAQARPRRPLSAASVRRYGPVLRAWMRFLQEQPCDWWAATPALLEAFASSRAPSSRHHAQASSVTVARYWWLVHSLYADLPALALRHGFAPLPHPLALCKAPAPARSEAADSALLPPWLVDAVRAELAAPLPLTDGRQPLWALVRDRAALALVLATGATVADLAELRVEDLRLAPARAGRPGRVRLGQAAEPTSPRQRQLDLDEDASRWLAAWIAEREILGPRSPACFVGGKNLQPLSAVHLWRRISATVEQAMRQVGQGRPFHVGPNLLRNSVLLDWLNRGRDLRQVQRDAGLAEPRALKRLLAFASERVQVAAQAVLEAPDGPDETTTAAGDARRAGERT